MGKLYVVSTGPGGTGYLTSDASKYLKDSDIIIGYSKYIKSIQNEVSDKQQIISSGMTKEKERYLLSVEKAVAQDSKIALVSNGDVNVFSATSQIVQIIEDKNLWSKIELICAPGVTSMFAAASKCGAPIGSDFAALSLTDKDRDINIIEQKIKYAIKGDFVIGVYNPLTHKKSGGFLLLLKYLKNINPKTPVAIASNIGRKSEKITISNVEELISLELENEYITPSTVIIIGNSQTTVASNGMLLTKNYS